jgi:hypothetical protein
MGQASPSLHLFIVSLFPLHSKNNDGDFCENSDDDNGDVII